MLYDFIVVGARCAGASLANFLGQYGYSVLLIDKYAEPGPTLSTHIVGETNVYDRLGVRKKMESAGAPFLTRFRVDLEGNVFESDMVVTSRALGLRRELLDHFLYEAALAHSSVKVMLRTKVRSVIWNNGKVTGVVCHHDDGHIKEYYGKVVIGADGRKSIVGKSVKAKKLRQTKESHHAIFYAYLKDVSPLPIPTFEWYWDKEEIILCNPIDQGIFCIAIMIPKEQSSNWMDDVQHSFMERIKKIKTLAPRLKEAQIISRIRGVADLESYLKKPYGDGWALVGDAGAHLHPITGVGIDNAVCSAEYLAEQLHQYMCGIKSWDMAMNEYERLRNERLEPQYFGLIRTLSYTKATVSEEAKESLGLLCTFPSLVKNLGMRSTEVINLINN